MPCGNVAHFFLLVLFFFTMYHGFLLVVGEHRHPRLGFCPPPRVFFFLCFFIRAALSVAHVFFFSLSPRTGFQKNPYPFPRCPAPFFFFLLFFSFFWRSTFSLQVFSSVCTRAVLVHSEGSGLRFSFPVVFAFFMQAMVLLWDVFFPPPLLTTHVCGKVHFSPFFNPIVHSVESLVLDQTSIVLLLPFFESFGFFVRRARIVGTKAFVLLCSSFPPPPCSLASQ